MRKTIVIALLVSVACMAAGEDKDPIKEKLFAAKVAYDKEMRQIRKQVTDWFDKHEDTARKAGDKKALDQIKEDRKAYEENGELPKSMPKTLQQAPERAKKKLEAAYAEAIKAYTKAKKDNLAAAVEKEWNEVNGKAARADTEDFLKPENWEGRSDIWTLDPKTKTLVGESTKFLGYSTYFCSKKTYSDFELTCKVQLRDGAGNSGIQVRTTLFGDTDRRVSGPQADVGKNAWGALYGEGAVGGWMKAPDPAQIKKAVKETEFNDYYVLVKGTHITVKINGETMVDQDFPPLPGKEAKPVPKDGIIAFQVDCSHPKMRVEFKDIKFTDLSKAK